MNDAQWVALSDSDTTLVGRGPAWHGAEARGQARAIGPRPVPRVGGTMKATEGPGPMYPIQTSTVILVHPWRGHSPRHDESCQKGASRGPTLNLTLLE